MAVSNVDHLLRFMLQTTCIPQLQEMRRNVRHAEQSTWNMLVRIVGQLTKYTGVVDVNTPIGMLRIN